MPLLAHIRNVLFPRRAVTAAVTDPAFRDRRGDGRPQSKIQNRKSQTANRSAFTLVELLVVIAIIGILISMVMPSLRGAQESARQVGCAAHQRQFGLLFALFASDYNGYILGSRREHLDWPFFSGARTYPWSNSFGFQRILGALYCQHPGYAPGRRPQGIWGCPSSRATFSDGSAGWSDYGQNNWLVKGEDNKQRPIRYSQVQSPSETMQMMDARDLTWPGIWLAGSEAYTTGQISDRHNGMANVLYCDGSVRRVKQLDIPPYWPKPSAGTPWYPR